MEFAFGVYSALLIGKNDFFINIVDSITLLMDSLSGCMTEGSIMQNYETMVIIDAMITEEAVDREVRKIEAVISAAGTLVNVDRQGKRKLGYEIRKKTHGVYVLFYFDAEAGVNVSEQMEKDFRINENVLRWITLSDQPRPDFSAVEEKEEVTKEVEA